MRLLLVVALVIVCCHADFCSQFPASSLYSITDGVLSTSGAETAIVPAMDTSSASSTHKALGLVSSLNGGQVRVFFAHNTDLNKRLYWSVYEGEEKIMAQLCVKSETRRCFSAKEVDLDPDSDLTMQAKAEKAGSYLRFSLVLSQGQTSQSCSQSWDGSDGLTVDNGVANSDQGFRGSNEPAQSISTPVTLSQVFRSSDFPIAKEWELELQPAVSQSVSISHMTILNLESGKEAMEIRLWPDTCVNYQQFSDLFSEISGSTTPSTFQPRVCPQLIPTYWGAPNSVCTTTNAAGGPYTFTCTGSTGGTGTNVAMPAFCMQDVAGNFLFTMQGSTVSRKSTYVGPMISPNHQTKDGTHIATLVTENTVAFRWRNGGSGSTDNVGKNKEFTSSTIPTSSPPLFMGIKKMGGNFEIRYTTDDTKAFTDWTLSTTTPVITSDNIPPTFDLCGILSSDAAGTATFDNVRLTLLPA